MGDDGGGNGIGVDFALQVLYHELFICGVEPKPRWQSQHPIFYEANFLHEMVFDLILVVCAIENAAS